MEKFLLKSFVLGLALLALAHCNKKEEVVNGLDPYVTVNGQFTQKDTDAIEGSGTIRFNSTLPGLTSDKYIEIKGILYPNGSVSVVMNSDDMGLSDAKGVIFQMSRSSEPLNVQPIARILVQGNAVPVAAQRLAYFNSSSFDVIVEVHNTPTRTRVLVWRKELLTYSLASVDIDTATPSHLAGAFPAGSGQGIFAGLKISNAKITAAQLGDAKVVLP